MDETAYFKGIHRNYSYITYSISYRFFRRAQCQDTWAPSRGIIKVRKTIVLLFSDTVLTYVLVTNHRNVVCYWLKWRQ